MATELSEIEDTGVTPVAKVSQKPPPNNVDKSKTAGNRKRKHVGNTTCRDSSPVNTNWRPRAHNSSANTKPNRHEFARSTTIAGSRLKHAGKQASRTSMSPLRQ